MTDKELLKQLKALKSIKLSDDLKSSNRDLLLSQISNTRLTENLKACSAFNFKNLLAVFSQPLLVVVGVFVFIVTSLVLSTGLLKNSKPNNSLYIARIISEKAKLNTTFSQNQRDKLSLQFASDHAHDILGVLMDPEFNNEKNQVQIEKLNSSFLNEISKIKTKIEKNSSDLVLTKDLEEVELGSDIILANSSNEEEGLEIDIPEIEEEPVIDSELELEEEEEGEEEDLLSLSQAEIILEVEKLFYDGNLLEAREKLGEIEKSSKK